MSSSSRALTTATTPEIPPVSLLIVNVGVIAPRTVVLVVVVSEPEVNKVIIKEPSPSGFFAPLQLILHQ